MDSLSDTKKLILDVFWEKGIQKDYHLSLFDLFYKSFQWHQNHQDNFLKALSLLIDEGIIKWGEAYALIITETGYNFLLEPTNKLEPSIPQPLIESAFQRQGLRVPHRSH